MLNCAGLARGLKFPASPRRGSSPKGPLNGHALGAPLRGLGQADRQDPERSWQPFPRLAQGLCRLRIPFHRVAWVPYSSLQFLSSWFFSDLSSIEMWITFALHTYHLYDFKGPHPHLGYAEDNGQFSSTCLHPSGTIFYGNAPEV